MRSDNFVKSHPNVGLACILGLDCILTSGDFSLSARCPVSHYCPNGSALPQVCDPGKYCSRPELSEPEFDCEAGFYCTSGAKEANPRDGVTGDICPTGTYCPRGSDAPKSCPIGTFLNSTGNR